ncbi:E3 ubiquitin-protein ligase PUB22 [Capsicum annuum]|uniref:U-box domain-containing protein n=1 Tax=Capsicum annuum TaxID=4072 RepID=A0A1U8EN04_CAPAN|nr:E3 ubiquitin-protein ligase PUB23-like [Capsicum annuum]KAF3616406.1 E3 ubiquitin-protein ligase PUB22 [Capsicum annuum]KAF3640754.1 E3 ubiquitin-protein ligase PUB22 [Capsicum annuum]PHT93984.1 E3 ubiquitin-protein ligase PUB22 [Capsicum annuum]
MEDVEVPDFFLCPISMQLMRDPVTTSTGITYDRENIEKWLVKCKNTTCPVTKQELLTTDLTPNHTLRRLIQSWCIMNSSDGVESIPTPKPQVTKSHVLKLIKEAMVSQEMQLSCLRKLRYIVHANESNKRCLESCGIVDFLASIIMKKEVVFIEDSEFMISGKDTLSLIVSSDDIVSPKDSELDELSCDNNQTPCVHEYFTKTSDEALHILFHLNPSDEDLKKLVTKGGDELFLDSLLHFLKCGNYQSRAYAIMLLKSAFNVADPGQLNGVRQEYFKEILSFLNTNKLMSQQAIKAALKLLVELCPWGRNRIKATEGGGVSTLIELLLDTTERRHCELILIVLHQLCSCAEGRAELLSHGAGLAIISKKILRVSQVASDRAVRILSSISKFSATPRVLQEMLQVGVVSKLCLVIQVDSCSKTKEKAKEILRLHSRVWRDSSCVPPHLLSSYPS